MKCCFCGPVRNCGPFIVQVLKNIETLGTLFNEYRIIVFYDHSEDDSLAQLKKFQQTNKKLHIHINSSRLSPFRTRRS